MITDMTQCGVRRKPRGITSGSFDQSSLRLRGHQDYLKAYVYCSSVVCRLWSLLVAPDSTERSSTRPHDGSRVQSPSSWRCSRRLSCKAEHGQRINGPICSLRVSSDQSRARRPLQRTEPTRNAPGFFPRSAGCSRSASLSWTARQRCAAVLPKPTFLRGATTTSATTRTATYARHRFQRSTTATTALPAGRLSWWTAWARSSVKLCTWPASANGTAAWTRCSTKLYAWSTSTDGTAGQAFPAALSVWTGVWTGSVANQDPEYDQDKPLGSLLPTQQAAGSCAKTWPD